MDQLNIPRDGLITQVAVITINSSQEKVFAFISDAASLPKMIRQYGPIHGVEKSVLHKGPWSAPGAYRTIYFDSGDTLREELMAFDAPHYFAYNISAFTNFARFLTRIAYGEWWFKQQGNATEVTWKYSFKPKNFLTKIPLSIFVRQSFGKYMHNCLLNAKQLVESGG